MIRREPELYLEQERQLVIAEARDSRPKNTKIAYKSKQTEFINWMNCQGFQDQITVTGPKVVAFLRSIPNRQSRTHGNRKLTYKNVNK
jgi:hypothetical protein